MLVLPIPMNKIYTERLVVLVVIIMLMGALVCHMAAMDTNHTNYQKKRLVSLQTTRKNRHVLVTSRGFSHLLRTLSTTPDILSTLDQAMNSSSVTLEQW